MTLKRNRRWIGWVGSAVALRMDKDNSTVLMRNNSYKLIAVMDSNIQLGNSYKVEIVKALKTRLIGKIIK